ncbi:hypothetical protein JTE90_011891 [Oedothorax gibbosus]|uniref:Uncharacterized protein n=1 Tax=Oedothorax gibbosus TaxID=931172 RepID=A0AAV6TX01_9ARAC|nr:hypothetical protein JTE90_011891 [Oedothorax gibbosus]
MNDGKRVHRHMIMHQHHHNGTHGNGESGNNDEASGEKGRKSDDAEYKTRSIANPYINTEMGSSLENNKGSIATEKDSGKAGDGENGQQTAGNGEIDQSGGLAGGGIPNNSTEEVSMNDGKRVHRLMIMHQHLHNGTHGNGESGNGDEASGEKGSKSDDAEYKARSIANPYINTEMGSSLENNKGSIATEKDSGKAGDGENGQQTAGKGEIDKSGGLTGSGIPNNSTEEVFMKDGKRVHRHRTMHHHNSTIGNGESGNGDEASGEKGSKSDDAEYKARSIANPYINTEMGSSLENNKGSIATEKDSGKAGDGENGQQTAGKGEIDKSGGLTGSGIPNNSTEEVFMKDGKRVHRHRTMHHHNSTIGNGESGNGDEASGEKGSKSDDAEYKARSIANPYINTEMGSSLENNKGSIATEKDSGKAGDGENGQQTAGKGEIDKSGGLTGSGIPNNSTEEVFMKDGKRVHRHRTMHHHNSTIGNGESGNGDEASGEKGSKSDDAEYKARSIANPYINTEMGSSLENNKGSIATEKDSGKAGDGENGQQTAGKGEIDKSGGLTGSGIPNNSTEEVFMKDGKRVHRHRTMHHHNSTIGNGESGNGDEASGEKGSKSDDAEYKARSIANPYINTEMGSSLENNKGSIAAEKDSGKAGDGENGQQTAGNGEIDKKEGLTGGGIPNNSTGEVFMKDGKRVHRHRTMHHHNSTIRNGESGNGDEASSEKDRKSDDVEGSESTGGNKNSFETGSSSEHEATPSPIAEDNLHHHNGTHQHGSHGDDGGLHHNHHHHTGTHDDDESGRLHRHHHNGRHGKGGRPGHSDDYDEEGYDEDEGEDDVEVDEMQLGRGATDSNEKSSETGDKDANLLPQTTPLPNIKTNDGIDKANKKIGEATKEGGSHATDKANKEIGEATKEGGAHATDKANKEIGEATKDGGTHSTDKANKEIGEATKEGGAHATDKANKEIGEATKEGGAHATDKANKEIGEATKDGGTHSTDKANRRNREQKMDANYKQQE